MNIPLRKRETKYKTQRGAAAYFGVTENTLRSWNCPCVFVGKIRARKQGCRVRYDLTEVEAWLRSRSAAVVQKGAAVPDAPPSEKEKPEAGAKVERKLTPWEERKVQEFMRQLDCSREDAMKYVARMAKQTGGAV